MKAAVLFLGNVVLIAMMVMRGADAGRFGGKHDVRGGHGGNVGHGKGGGSGHNSSIDDDGEYPPFEACKNLTETLCPSCVLGSSLGSCLAECFKANEAAFEAASCGPKPPGGRHGSYPTLSDSCGNATKTICGNCTTLALGESRWACFMGCFAAHSSAFAADCGPTRPPTVPTSSGSPATHWPTTIKTERPTSVFTRRPTSIFTRRPTSKEPFGRGEPGEGHGR